MPKTPFVAPRGVRFVRVDRRSGKRVHGGFPSITDAKPTVIWDVFKPETEPKRTIRKEELLARLQARKARARAEAIARLRAQQGSSGGGQVANDNEFLNEEGGIY